MLGLSSFSYLCYLRRHLRNRTCHIPTPSLECTVGHLVGHLPWHLPWLGICTAQWAVSERTSQYKSTIRNYILDATCAASSHADKTLQNNASPCGSGQVCKSCTRCHRSDYAVTLVTAHSTEMLDDSDEGVAAKLERASESWAKHVGQGADIGNHGAQIARSAALFREALSQEGVDTRLADVLCRHVLKMYHGDMGRYHRVDSAHNLSCR
ncbi:hypothetical protein HaLaN_16799 [Haematococcus lacustris]|uniref:Uncharacterized protein n=1 Tax=Haematococcus lacustris TaxID=44745 RepID=A0A699ZLI2_HAELA|nr:hypothetical protein HaLaN_16799 [Haematococcus lacustris]